MGMATRQRAATAGPPVSRRGSAGVLDPPAPLFRRRRRLVSAFGAHDVVGREAADVTFVDRLLEADVRSLCETREVEVLARYIEREDIASRPGCKHLAERLVRALVVGRREDRRRIAIQEPCK